MGITYYDPTSRTGPDGYINYKMSGGGKGGNNSCGGPGGIFWAVIMIIAAVLELMKYIS